MPSKKPSTKPTSTALMPKDPNTSSTPKPDSEGKTSKKRTHADDDNSTPEDANPPKTKKPKKQSAPAPADLHDIKLPFEDIGDVPIYDTCDDIRKKITDHLLKSPNANQAAFARELAALVYIPQHQIDSAPNQSESAIDGRQLGNFMKKKGPRNGAHMMVFYAAYVYFEKLRIRDGKKKLKKREDMEDAWGEDGLPREGSHNTYLLCFGGQKPKLDRLGKLQMVGNRATGGIKSKRLT